MTEKANRQLGHLLGSLAPHTPLERRALALLEKWAKQHYGGMRRVGDDLSGQSLLDLVQLQADAVQEAVKESLAKMLEKIRAIVDAFRPLIGRENADALLFEIMLHTAK